MEIKTPFDVMNHLGKDSFNEIANVDKKRHSFIINRMLSRALPDVAFNMSHQRIAPEILVDYWHFAFLDLDKTFQGKKVLTTIRKVTKISMAGAKKKTKSKIDKELSNKFMVITGMGKKEFDILVKFYENETIKYLKKFSKMLQTSK